ncbi:glycerophosphoryl diester phosphodiesterase [Olivibacter sp. SDN3]|uniref:glycerophosphoryl diester phosphodiesterase n=1 Tax=Olivibacter sp. SDN3 TaxID=2764720 RepID=UPI0016516F4E|nr:glycerophosphoryl diester phosphodiesterase [Olivibacter sp. SDN3]QNL51080.1 glycerophosphoryl diester phosphodiesterase [Olivibacter sp. SDN3]
MIRKQQYEQLSDEWNVKTKLLLSVIIISFIHLLSANLHAQEEVVLENQFIRLRWEQTSKGYALGTITLNPDADPITIDKPQGHYVGLYSAGQPDTTVNTKLFEQANGHRFSDYKYIVQRVIDGFRPVPLNTAGEVVSFLPASAKKTDQGIEFFQENPQFSANINWSLDRLYAQDVLVEIKVKANQAGYFSFASPTLFSTEPDELEWAMLPGYFQGREIQPDLLRAYAYGQGIPGLPVVVRERTASTLSPLIQNKQGVTLAVIPEPGVAAHPWLYDKSSRGAWKLGLSLMNRGGQLSPTLYHPVLGEIDSYLEVGEERVFRFRYAIQKQDWFSVYKHAIYDIYKFDQAIKLKNTGQSLTDRMLSMLKYLRDDSTSLWNVHTYQGMQIGAQSYLGGVVGADRDAMKNADYGAMWMLARLTGDSILRKTRLQAARNFKLTQQQTDEGFFKGAAIGQYYLWKSRRFTEEWGDYVEPIALTYYTMLDIGNILLFEPQDREMKDRLRSGADKLLEWQQADGSWLVAYDKHTEQPQFSDLSDLRPTFYGLLVAYRLLGDDKYLQAAEKGANWYVAEAINKGHFLGVCGDVRFVPDFATGQSAQALLDLYELTDNKTYLEAAVNAAKLYTSSIYTHPIPTQQVKEVRGKQKEDWEITQVGLSFEHGGTLGSANGGGPILLASHAGLFVRMAKLTGERIFLDMARAAAWGRDAFVDPATHVASYYWERMDDGPGPFPHHAWWQVGWITDYLIAEITARSGGKIDFPRGFITPKVGPHQSYGFAAGKVFGTPVDLYLPTGMVSVANPQVDFMAAKASQGTDMYLILLNNSTVRQKSAIALHELPAYSQAVLLDEKGDKIRDLSLEDGNFMVDMPVLGLKVVKLSNRGFMR